MKNFANKKPIYKRVWFWLIIVIIIGAMTSGASKNDTKIVSNKETEVKQEKKIPAEYKSALNSAETYANMMNMSKKAVYNQLISKAGDEFSTEAAQYAVDHVKADWKANALASAKNYQDIMSMSPSAIKRQLTSNSGDKFTKAEADYAIKNLNK